MIKLVGVVIIYIVLEFFMNSLWFEKGKGIIIEFTFI